MTETTITVRGHHAAYYPAERATLHFKANFDGADRSEVFASATATSDRLRGRIVHLHDDKTGPITWWSSDSVRVWGDRPWNEHGNQLPIVYHAAIDFTAKFNDFDELARFIEESVDVEGVSIGYIHWTLSEKRTRSVTHEVQSKAVADAVGKATVYAKAIGFSTVKAVAVADPGMLGDQTRPVEEYGMERASLAVKSMDVGGAAELSFKPQDIEVSATVDARFVAS